MLLRNDYFEKRISLTKNFNIIDLSSWVSAEFKLRLVRLPRKTVEKQFQIVYEKITHEQTKISKEKNKPINN